MKNACKRWAMLLALGVVVAPLTVRGQAAREGLDRAVEALEQRDEATAWQLYQSHRDLLNQVWFDIDWKFVAWVADQLRRQHDFDEALELCSRIMDREGEINPELAAAVMMVRGDVFRDQQNYAAARLEYAGVDRHDRYRQTEAGRAARFRLLDIMRRTREYESALQMIERLKDIRDIEVQADAYYHHAHIAFDRQDYELAREMIAEVKARRPEHVEAVFLEGEINLLQNRLQDPELEIGQQRLQTFVVPGRPIVVRMQDPNLAVARGGGGIPITFRTSEGRDRENIMLMPSPRDPSLFRGSIRTELGQAEPGNMVLELLGSDRVVYNIDADFQRDNDLAFDDKFMIVVDDAELNVSSGEFLDQEERDARALQRRVASARAAQQDEDSELRAFERERDVNIVRPGNPIYIQVADADRSVSVTRDTVRVAVEASSGASIEEFELQETEPHSGVFQGVLPTQVSPPRARASSAASGYDAEATIDAGRAQDVWRSGNEGEQSPWLEVDLMQSASIRSADLNLVEGHGVRRVTLSAGRLTDDLEQVSDTQPSRELRYGFLDLNESFDSQRNTAAYIYTEVNSPRAQQAVLKIGTADGVVCWINGERVHRSQRGRSWTPEEDVVPVELQEGVNGVLLKVFQVTGTWGASVSIVDDQGRSLTDSDDYRALATGVVTSWHVFDMATDADIETPARVNVRRSVRVRDRVVRWIPRSVAPSVSLVFEGDRVGAEFHADTGWRRLRWVFEDMEGTSLAVREAQIHDRFDELLVPVDTAELQIPDTGDATSLAIGPGDTVETVYHDQLRTRDDDGILRATMRSGYHNARVQFEYETVRTDARGERHLIYDRAIRYRPGDIETLMVRVIDYDEDRTPERDTVTVTVSTTSGETLELEALETGRHTGEFLATLRLGDTTDPAQDMLAVKAGDDIEMLYYDTENSDGVLERRAWVRDAGDSPPQFFLYQTIVMRDTEGLRGDPGEIVTDTRLSRDRPDASEPVITSLEAPLSFRVHYPMAALSENSDLTARLTTAAEQAAAEEEGREPEYTEVSMRLISAEDAMFEANIMPRLGGVRDALEDMDATSVPILPVRGEDDVIVEVVSLNPGNVVRAVFRLASDARLAFTDRRYDREMDGVHAGDYLYIRLEDLDRSISDELDTVTVVVTGSVDSVRMELVETMPHSGVFTGRLKTDLAGVDLSASDDEQDSVFQVKYGENVRALYQDERTVASTVPQQVKATARVHHGDDGTVLSFTRRFRDDEVAVQTRLLTAEALFEMAKEHRKGGAEELAADQMQEGKMLLEEAIVGFPGSPFASQAEFLLANLAQELEQYEQALERYNRVLAMWPDSEYAPRALLRKAQTLERIGDPVNAADTYVELTYTYPDNVLVPDAVVRLGQLFYRLENYPVAARVFANFERNNPEHSLAPRALFLAGQSYSKGAEERKTRLEQERYDRQSQEWLSEAVSVFERLINTYPEERDLRAEAMYWAGDILVKRGDMPGAYQWFTRLRWDYPESNWARFARGRLTDRAFERLQ